MAGLEELPALPRDFPVTVAAPTGRITRAPDAGQVATDVLFDDEAAARAAFASYVTELHDHGFQPDGQPPPATKWESQSFAGANGRVVLGCCPKRADGQVLVLVSWWPNPTLR